MHARALTQPPDPRKTRQRPGAQCTPPPTPPACLTAHPLVSRSSSTCRHSACFTAQVTAPFHLLRVEECPHVCLPMGGCTCSPPAHKLTHLFWVCWRTWPGNVSSWETIRLSRGIYLQMLCVHMHSFLELRYLRAHSRQQLGGGPPSSPLLNALLPITKDTPSWHPPEISLHVVPWGGRALPYCLPGGGLSRWTVLLNIRWFPSFLSNQMDKGSEQTVD